MLQNCPASHREMVPSSPTPPRQPGQVGRQALLPALWTHPVPCLSPEKSMEGGGTKGTSMPLTFKNVTPIFF